MKFSLSALLKTVGVFAGALAVLVYIGMLIQAPLAVLIITVAGVAVYRYFLPKE
jgi:hypothetical protein